MFLVGRSRLAWHFEGRSIIMYKGNIFTTKRMAGINHALLCAFIWKTLQPHKESQGEKNTSDVCSFVPFYSLKFTCKKITG